jgi:hypothetical protein
MSVERVTLSPSDDNYAPSAHEIEVAVIGNDVLISVYDGSLDDLIDGRKKVYDVPPLALKELVAAYYARSNFEVEIRDSPTEPWRKYEVTNAQA